MEKLWIKNDAMFEHHKYLKYDDKNIGTTKLYSQPWLKKRKYSATSTYATSRMKIEPEDPNFQQWVYFTREDGTVMDQILEVYDDTDHFLGCNMLSDKFLVDFNDGKTPWWDITSPDVLCQTNDPWLLADGAPGLYIVGSAYDSNLEIAEADS